MSKDNIIVYCTEGNVIYDSNGEHKDKTKRAKGFKIKKNVVNPIFESMRSCNDDSFWDMFLLKASRDNFPKGFSFNDDRLYYSMKSKYNFDIKLDPNFPNESFLELKEFVSDKGILSDKDKDILTQEQIDTAKDIDEVIIDNWKDLGKLQSNTLFSYISELSERHALTTKERKQLESTIKIGISSGYLNNKNIVVENSFIKDIIPLLWDEEIRSYSIDTKNIRLKKIKPSKVDTNDLSTDNTTTCLNFDKKYTISNINKKWEKFLKTVYKVR
jgi:hypothetical protein